MKVLSQLVHATGGVPSFFQWKVWRTIGRTKAQKLLLYAILFFESWGVIFAREQKAFRHQLGNPGERCKLPQGPSRLKVFLHYSYSIQILIALKIYFC